MDFSIQGSRPIWQQLMEQLARRIITGVYPQGSRFPAVRELAAEAGVNPNTVQKAYRQLEEEGLIQSRPGAGSHITASREQIDQIRSELFRTEVQETVAAMKGMGLKKEEAVELLRRLYDEEEEG